MANENLTFFAEFTLNNVNAQFKDILYDMNQVEGTPGSGFDYQMAATIGKVSTLDIMQIRGRYGFEFDWRTGWFATSSFEHFNYDDKNPYLFDTTGNMYRVTAAVGYRF